MRFVRRLAAGLRTLGLGEALIDAVLAVNLVEAMDPRSSGPAIVSQVGELEAIIDYEGTQVVGP